MPPSVGSGKGSVTGTGWRCPRGGRAARGPASSRNRPPPSPLPGPLGGFPEPGGCAVCSSRGVEAPRRQEGTPFPS